MRMPILDKLDKDLMESQKELTVDIPKALAQATAMGDLSENAEYKSAKERQSFLQARISQITKRISDITSLDIRRISSDESGLGSTLKLKHIDSGEEKTYYLVFPEEVNPDEGKVSLASPVGRALVKKQVGDEVTLPFKGEQEDFEVIHLQTIHDIDAEES
jgi:transcription elongation factor GreA